MLLKEVIALALPFVPLTNLPLSARSRISRHNESTSSMHWLCTWWILRTQSVHVGQYAVLDETCGSMNERAENCHGCDRTARASTLGDKGLRVYKCKPAASAPSSTQHLATDMKALLVFTDREEGHCV